MAILFNPIYLQSNQGHGKARRVSLSNCTNNLVAIMDADDISLPYRFKIQVERFIKDKLLSIVGGQIAEFENEESNITGIRKVPEKHDDIVKYAQKRSPMNQVSVMFKKSDVEQAGGYQNWYCNEDYYLWLRMMEQGFQFANVPDVLVNVRTGEAMSARRSGWNYFLSEAKLQKYMLERNIISVSQFIYNTGIRFVGEILLPNKLRNFAFKILRSKVPKALKATKADSITDITDTTEKKQNIALNITHSTYDNKNEDKECKECKEYPPFSVAMCVYEKDNPEWFDIALESIIINQTVKPSEVVLVVDGPIPNTIQLVIDKYQKICRGGGGNI